MRTLPDLAPDFLPRRPGVLPFVLCIAAATLLADAAMDEADARNRADELKRTATQAGKRLDRLAGRQREQRAEDLLSADEARAVHQADAALSVAWERLFAAVDNATGEDVALLALRPNLSGHAVQISGEARDMAAALAFVESLRRAPLQRVVLLSHNVRNNEPGRPVYFEISAEWTGSASHS